MNIKSVRIGRKVVGERKPCYVIAEIGSNFNGDINLAKKLIKKAKEAGADAAKFQSFQVEKILSKKGFAKKVSFQAQWKKPVWEVYKEAELPLEWIEKLSKYALKHKIDFLSAPYHIEAVDELMKYNVPAIKIGSGEITNLEFLKYISKTKKPILLATGASNQIEVSQAVNTILKLNKRLIIMQATTQYPSPVKETNLRVIESFRHQFKVNIGYSDHTPGFTAILGSVALGACVIEKHFTLDRTSQGPDHPHSLDFNEFKDMVSKIREMENALGGFKKKVEDSEVKTRKIQRRGVWTVKKIKKNEIFTNSNLEVLRPCQTIDASKITKIIGKKSKRNLKAYTALRVEDY